MEANEQVRFGIFELNFRSGELRRGGMRFRLHDKPLRLLIALLERPGEVVSREELFGHLWGDDIHVDFDNNLNAAVKKLRDALGDFADSPRFVETVPRRGYRFIAPVLPVTVAQPEKARRIPRLSALALTVLAMLVGLGALFVLRDRMGTVAPTGSDGERRLLAVMPVLNLSPGGDEYLADSLTEELITHLGRLDPDRLGVIARISSMTYKDSDLPVDRIARELGVDYVVESSVRSQGNRLRVTVQLIEAAGQTHLWAATYDRDRDDLLAVQAEVAQQVARALALELLPDGASQVRAATASPEAYEAYLRGRWEWNRFSTEGYRRAITAFRQAQGLDPAFAPAWAGEADAWNLLVFTGEVTPQEAFPAARAAVERALALDPRLALAHNALGFARLYGDFAPRAALEDFDRAVEIAPNYAMAHHWRAGALAALGRHDDAITAVRRSLELDPLSLSVMSDLGWYFLFANRPEEAVEECTRTLEIDPHYGWARACLEIAYEQLREPEKGLEAALRGRPREDDPADPVAALAEHRRRLLSQVQGDPLRKAMLTALLGQPDEAFGYLDEAIVQRDPWLVFLRVDPRLAALRQDRRFEARATSLSKAAPPPP
ncbi:MAG: winged helix-turn-helix domain-containing protein [Acidobacteriota bacterium]